MKQEELIPTIQEEGPEEERKADGTQERIAAFERLHGLLKFDGDPPTDEEVKDMITDYLVEKYSRRDG